MQAALIMGCANPGKLSRVSSPVWYQVKNRTQTHFFWGVRCFTHGLKGGTVPKIGPKVFIGSVFISL